MDEGYARDYAKWEEEGHWWFKGRDRILRTLIAKYILRPSGRALDAGCGTGGSYELLKKFSRVIVGVDIAPHILRQNRKHRLRAASAVENTALKDRLFEFVAALDVIEHTESDLKAVSELCRVCKPGGIIVITVPALRLLWGRQDELSRHRKRYRMGELRSLVENEGLSILKISYFNTFLFPAVLAVRLLLRFFSRTVRSDFALFPSPFINRVCESIFSLEAEILTLIDFPFGVSLVCIAKRPAEKAS
jgi:SAM-dependent methyltransferase